jgi:colanic acid/amylovoran biosynthesis glycosyltransferase
MKIAFVINQFPVISETFILAQIVGLLQRGHDLTIYAEEPDTFLYKHHADVERFHLIDRTCYRASVPNSKVARIQSAALLMLRWVWRCPSLVLDSLNVFVHGRRALDLSLMHERFGSAYPSGNYDVIHAHFGLSGNRALDWREAGILRGPIITTFHGYDVNSWPKTQGSRIYARLFKHGDLFTVGSEFMRQRLIELGAPAQKIVKIPMGVDLKRYQFSERPKLVNGEFRLLTIARLVDVKGIEFALRALAILKPSCQQLRYQIAGDGPLRVQLEALSRELGLEQAVEFLGPVSQDEVLHLYQRAHAFVLPCIVTDSGEEEGQSVVLAEAQACGLPVIASSVGGIPESMCDGVSGFLTPPRDATALAAAILQVFERPESWGPMGRAGRAHVEAFFDLEKLNHQLVEVYNSTGIRWKSAA